MSSPIQGPHRSYEAVARFLVGDGDVPDPTDLEAHGLEALAYVRVPQPHPQHDRWRDAYLARIATHLAAVASVADLVRAWRERNIEVLLFKGFYLAEFLYASPAERFYRDIDILVPEAAAGLAIQVAVDQGWSVAASRRGSSGGKLHGHMEAVLVRQGARIDLHRFVVHASSPGDRTARRYTAVAWAGSSAVDWQGTTIRVLDPRDSALMGLVVGRAWSHDGWRLKTPDYRDMEVLADRLGLTRESLAARADELGCPMTLELMLDRCDPWRRRLDLTPPSDEQQRAWSRAVAHEHGPRMSWLRRRLAGTSPMGIAAAIPRLWRARRLISRFEDPADLLARVRNAPARVAPMPTAERMRLFDNMRVAAALVQPTGDRCMIRSLALFEALRERGEPVTLCLGVDADGHRHAWIRHSGSAATLAQTWGNCPVAEVVASSPSPALET